MNAEVKERIKQEYLRCAKDPAYFMKKYCYIQHPIKGRILFNLYPFQEKVLRLFRDNKNLITLKSRQLGISTLAAGYSLWLMTFHKDKNVLALATTQATAKNLVSKVIFMYDELPKWLKVPHKEKNKLSLGLKNGSKIAAKSSSIDSARSEAVSLLLIDEAAFIDNIGETYTAAQPTMATGGQAMVLSCVVGDTYVYTDQGIKQVKEFIKNDQLGFVEIEPYSILGRNKIRSSNLFYNNGEVKTLKIKTKFSELEGSENHKLYAYNKGKFDWYRLDELSKSSYVAIQGGLNIWGNQDELDFIQLQNNNRKQLEFDLKKVTPNLAYLIGLYIAEGSSDGKHSIDITCGDNIDNELNKLGLTYTKDPSRLAKRITNTNLIEVFKVLGVNLEGQKAQDKTISKKLLSLSKENTVAMLQGLFDGDGTVVEKGVVAYTSVSKELVDKIRIILLNLGIYSTYTTRSVELINEYIKEKKLEGEKVWAENWYLHKHDPHILEISGKDLEKFHQEVGFRFERKQKKLEIAIKNRKSISRKSTKDVIPGAVDLIKLLQERSGNSQYRFIIKSKVSLSKILNKTKEPERHTTSRDVINRVYSKWSYLLNESEKEFWDDILNENLRWVSIKSIETSKNFTYDFSLPENELDKKWEHSVIYNGILGHQTPNGIGNWFHQTWAKAQSGDNTFVPIKLPWTVHPERDQSWRDEQDKDLGTRKAAQECDCDFLTSGDTVYETDDIKYYEEMCVLDPVEKRGIDGAYWIWKYPDYTRSYAIIADTARGDAEDNSGASVFDIETCEQVAEYHGKLSPKDFGNVLVNMGIDYNDALMVIENTNVGWATIQQVQERDYKNLYYSSKSDNETVESYMDKMDNDDLTAGFTNSVKTRPLLIGKLGEYIRERAIIIRSKRCTNELRVFVWKNGKPQAQTGYNDDLVLVCAIFTFIRDTALRLRQKGLELTKAQMESFLNSNTKQIIKTSGYNQINPYIMDTAYGQVSTLWLL